MARQGKIHYIISLILIFICIPVFYGCGSPSREMENRGGNGVYFWRTVFSLSPSEKDFLEENKIEKIYTRFFDVVNKDGKWMPEATLIFKDSFPSGVEIIPVVFIDSKALKVKEEVSALAPLILARVDSMMTRNGYRPAKEIEIDFDWTPSNQQRYFSLLRRMRDSLHSKNRTLSATIRLHQLALPEPPVDYGVLMVYNMGNFKNPKETNSIISTSTLRPYLRHLKDYPLPLKGALPLYSWGLLFHKGEFTAIARDVNLKDTLLFRPTDSIHFMARSYMPLPAGSTGASPAGRIYPGDVIRFEASRFPTVDSVRRMLISEREEMGKGIILYHLDDKTINTFNNNEIKKLYSGE